MSATAVDGEASEHFGEPAMAYKGIMLSDIPQS